MIYEVKISLNGTESEISSIKLNDSLLFDEQPKAFQKLFNELKQGNTGEFNNCCVSVIYTGKVIITPKVESEADNEI